MNVAAVIATMRAKGMSDTDILDVIQAGLDGGQRSAAAERQARYRERKAIEGATRNERDVTRDVTPPLEVPLSPAPLSSPNSPSKKTPKGVQKGSRLPADWAPSPALVEHAAGLGVTGQPFDWEVEKFRNYWIAKPGNAGIKLDWDATFRNWMISAAERLPRAGPSSLPPRPGTWAEFNARLNAK